jgi:predicted enzyme related to lactoylglutathione lyase
MKTNPVGWFEIPVLNMDRAVRFYESVGFLAVVLDTEGNRIALHSRK